MELFSLEREREREREREGESKSGARAKNKYRPASKSFEWPAEHSSIHRPRSIVPNRVDKVRRDSRRQINASMLDPTFNRRTKRTYMYIYIYICIHTQCTICDRFYTELRKHMSSFLYRLRFSMFIWKGDRQLDSWRSSIKSSIKSYSCYDWQTFFYC